MEMKWRKKNEFHGWSIENLFLWTDDRRKTHNVYNLVHLKNDHISTFLHLFLFFHHKRMGKEHEQRVNK